MVSNENEILGFFYSGSINIPVTISGYIDTDNDKYDNNVIIHIKDDSGNIIGSGVLDNNGEFNANTTFAKHGTYNIAAHCALDVSEEKTVDISRDTSYIILTSNRNILSFADVNENVSDENNLGKAQIQAEMYDKYNNPIPNQTINFYAITYKEYISDINLTNDELVLTTIKENEVNNTELITNITLTNGELVLTKANFSKNDANITNALTNINFE